MDFFMEYIFPWLMAGLILAVCVFVGILPAQAVESGFSGVLIWGLLAGIVMGLLGGWLTFMFADMQLEQPMRWAIGGGIVAFCATMFFPFDTLRNGHTYAAYTREIAPIVRTFALERFGDIDGDKNDLIVEAELDYALKTLTLTESERRALSHMRSHQDEVGHVIDSYTTTTYVWISTGSNGSGYMSPIITTHYIYGINRGDIEGFPQRMIEKWKKW